jgi:hypothetical protein
MSARTRTVVFDFDMTLTNWDTAERFFRWLLRRDRWRMGLAGQSQYWKSFMTHTPHPAPRCGNHSSTAACSPVVPIAQRPAMTLRRRGPASHGYMLPNPCAATSTAWWNAGPSVGER